MCFLWVESEVGISCEVFCSFEGYFILPEIVSEVIVIYLTIIPILIGWVATQKVLTNVNIWKFVVSHYGE